MWTCDIQTGFHFGHISVASIAHMSRNCLNGKMLLQSKSKTADGRHIGNIGAYCLICIKFDCADAEVRRPKTGSKFKKAAAAIFDIILTISRPKKGFFPPSFVCT